MKSVGLLAGIVSGACYGLMVFLIHIMGGKAPASEIAFLRASCAIAVFLPFALRHGRQWGGRKSILIWLRSVTGAISVLCLTWNLQHTSVGFANTLFNLAPIFVVILGTLAGQEKFEVSRFVNIILVVLASALFWHGSRGDVHLVNWLVGLGGMCMAAVAYSLNKSLPSIWSPSDITWALNLATLPVALLFKQGPWIPPAGRVGVIVGTICLLSLVGNWLVNVSFKYRDLSTATALIPSAIIWGVLLDTGEHGFPPVQGIAGCLLYLVATIRLATTSPRTNPPRTPSVAGAHK